jgi:DNA polymerase elongation subunit (family B)
MSEEIMYSDFADKRAVSLYSKGEMKSFIVDLSIEKSSGKEVRYLPNEDAFVKEVEENLSDILVVWDARQLKNWKLKNKIIVDIRDSYEVKVRPLSLRLNDVAVDEGFIPREELVEEYEKGYLVNLLSHTSDNASWISKLDRKYHFTDSLYSLMRLVDAPNIDYVMHGSILPIELLLTRIAKERGESLPKIKDTAKEGRWYEGGFVLEPPVGLFSNVAIMDFSKYYPSLMMDFNLSPEVTKIVDSKPILDFKKRGLIPEALEYLTKTRNELEEKLGKTKSEDPEWLRLTSDREAVKVTQNAMYGALASDQFSLKSRDLASFITSLGREGLRETILECERRGFKVLYADTDSVMAQVPLEKAETLARELTLHLQDYFKEKYDLPISKWELRLKFSKYAKTMIFHGKKNYAFWDGKNVEIVGLFRQARSHFAQRFQEEFYGMVLKGSPLKDLQSFVDRQLVEFRQASIEEVALCTKINQRIDQYKVASWHIKGAKNAQDLLGIKFEVGDTIKLVWLKDKPDIIGFEYEEQIAKFKDRVDCKRMEESLLSLVKPVLEILGRGKETKQKTLF